MFKILCLPGQVLEVCDEVMGIIWPEAGYYSALRTKLPHNYNKSGRFWTLYKLMIFFL